MPLQQRQNYVISRMNLRVNSSCTVLSVSFLLWCTVWYQRTLRLRSTYVRYVR